MSLKMQPKRRRDVQKLVSSLTPDERSQHFATVFEISPYTVDICYKSDLFFGNEYAILIKF